MFRLITATFLFTLICITSSGHAQAPQLPTVSVDGGSITGALEYEEHGSPDGEPVVMIQGSVIAEAFRPIAEQRSLDRFRVLRVHLRTYAGSSSVEPPFGAVQHAEDMVSFLRALDIDRAHFVGHSYGAAIALQVAIDVPEIVHSLVLAEPGLSPSVSAILQPGRQPRTDGENRRSVFEDPEYRQRFLDGLLTNCLGDKEMLSVIPGAYEQALGNGLDAMGIQAGTGATAMGTFDPAEHLPALSQPILFMAGSNPQQAAFAELIKEHHSNTEILSFPEAPHCFTILQPEEVADAIADFLATNQLRTGSLE